MFSKLLNNHKNFIKTISREKLNSLMSEFDNYEIEIYSNKKATTNQ